VASSGNQFLVNAAFLAIIGPGISSQWDGICCRLRKSFGHDQAGYACQGYSVYPTAFAHRFSVLTRNMSIFHHSK